MRLAPSEICYSQDSINNRFDSRSRHGDKRIGETLDDICEKRCTMERIPTISVKKIGGKWKTADNRRLWVFKHLERLGKCKTIPVIETSVIPSRKMTSYNGGKSVRVRGDDPGGQWYRQSALSTSRPTSVSNDDDRYNNTQTYQTDRNQQVASMWAQKKDLIYGHNPTTISEMVLKYTYGFRCMCRYYPNVHPISKRTMTEKGLRCADYFLIRARKGQTVHIGAMQQRHTYAAAKTHQPAIAIQLYASDKESPSFVDEPGCRKIGEVRLVFEAPHAMEYPEATVCLIFSGTEIVVDAVEVATGKKITSNMNFLG